MQRQNRDYHCPMDISCHHLKDPIPDLWARFSLRRGLFRRETVEVPVYQITDDQCLIKTDKTLEPGDRLTIELALDLPFENLVIPNLTGIIASSRKFCSNFFITLDFQFPGQQSLLEAVPAMQRMNDIINRKLALELRRAQGGRVAS